MIRAFDWRDVGAVRHLAEQGVCLDTETGLLQSPRPLQQALFAYLMPGPSAPTFVWRSHGTGTTQAFGQLRHHSGDEQARVLFLASTTPPLGWEALLDQLAAEAGKRRALNLLAEANENSLECDTLRRAGFAIYARQSFWRLPTSPTWPHPTRTIQLRPALRADLVNVHNLYNNLVPRLIQLAEPPPKDIENGYVLEEGGELIAFVQARRGPLGAWVEPFFHPEAFKEAEATLYAAWQALAPERAFYVCVRRYQDWVADVVARAGFEAVGEQVVMVKRLTARVTEPLPRVLTVAEGPVPTPATHAQTQITPTPPRS